MSAPADKPTTAADDLLPSQIAQRKSLKKWKENHPPATERAFRAGYEQAKRDAIDRCHIEKDGRLVADNAIDRCIRAIEPLDVRHALARSA